MNNMRKTYILSFSKCMMVIKMHPKTCRLCLSTIPAIFAFFLVSVVAMALADNGTIAVLFGLVGAVSSSAVIMKH